MSFKQSSRLKYIHDSGRFIIKIETDHSHISLYQVGLGRIKSEVAYDLALFLKEPSIASALCSPLQGVRETAQAIKRFMEYCDA